jgi:hypothetical protein
MVPSPLADLACRLWAAERRIFLDDHRRRGLRIVEWNPAQPLEMVLAATGRYQPAGGLAK